ncbi:phospholipase [Microbacterium sp. EST19A]|uniref:aggregation-promoting factor C-terminal-like domain-containing protein n=1 Tax=Microbacterium sp. EST19A TaxID=2862681 RepID=UPI001CC1803F|nr:phospholipase [Microbacterium sp. EST19A]
MLHESRALRRASAAASARVTTRRPMMILGTAAATLLGITLTAGMVSVPAAGSEMPDPTAVVAQLVTGAEPVAKVADDAAIPLVEAKDAVLTAEALAYDVAASGLDVSAAPAVDVSELQSDIDALDDRDALSSLVVTVLAGQVEAETKSLVSDTATLQEAFTAAQEKKAADDAAAAAAAQAEAAAAALASANTVDGAKATAQQLMSSRYGWGGDQFSCLDSLWNKESGWNYQAYNPSGATGIPQALPGSKMASEGSDWQTNAATQIAWGLGYISSVYGTPCSAWGHSQAMNWY